MSLSRRDFLGRAAAAASTATLIPASTLAGTREADEKTASNSTWADVSNQNLTSAPVAKVKWKAEPFPMTDVRLLSSFWKDMMELNRSFLYCLPNDRLVHNFRRHGWHSIRCRSAWRLGGAGLRTARPLRRSLPVVVRSASRRHRRPADPRQGQRTRWDARGVPVEGRVSRRISIRLLRAFEQA